jgi:CRISPR-associated protein Cas1
MIKRAIYFGNPAYISQSKKQLVIKKPEDNEVKMLPIEDIGVVILDNQQITITQSAMTWLLENNVAIITCDNRHHPLGLHLVLESNTIQSERFQSQIEASESLKKNLWQQTIVSKIYNQAMVLQELGMPIENMLHWSKEVTSGDAKNHEARAAAYYWENLLQAHENFRRERFGEYPNNFFNYAYAILRAITARSLVASGLLPTLGIHHKNRYNAYCLADDVMESYRPFADKLVLEIIKQYPEEEVLSTEIKAKLLTIPVLDVEISKHKRPLQIAMLETSASLSRCFDGELRKIKHPVYRGTV